MCRREVALVTRSAVGARVDVVEDGRVVWVVEGFAADVAVGMLGDQPCAELPVIASPGDARLCVLGAREGVRSNQAARAGKAG